MITQFFAFDGRLTRTRALIVFLKLILFYFLSCVICVVFPYFIFVSVFGFSISFLSICVRRLHDAGYSGWYWLVPIYHLFILCFESEKKDNKWGEYDKKVEKVEDAEVFKLK